MTKDNASGADRAWAMIEDEKRRSRFIRRVCIAAWVGTFTLALLFAALLSTQILQMWKGYSVGAFPLMTVIGASMPLLGLFWTLSLLIAALSTVGVFLQQRTASLTEIQLRLAALEEMLASRQEGPTV